jgi:hypothetical protein
MHRTMLTGQQGSAKGRIAEPCFSVRTRTHGEAQGEASSAVPI